MTVQTRTVDYEHEGAQLAAFVAWDDAAKQPRPAVMIAHAFSGRGPLECDKATALAELGYVGIALDNYGRGVLGKNPQESGALMAPFLKDRDLLLGRLMAGLEMTRRLPQVDAGQVAAMGFCFGGLCALDLARSGVDLRGVISFHGLFTPPATAQQQRIRAKVLVLHGWDDPMATPDKVLELAEELTAAGADWQIHAYGNTMHAFTNPAANDAERGTVYKPEADRRSWQSLLAFLAEVFAGAATQPGGKSQ